MKVEGKGGPDHKPNSVFKAYGRNGWVNWVNISVSVVVHAT
jgi:hypothetical protein